MDTLEMASIRHFLWSELPQLLRLATRSGEEKKETELGDGGVVLKLGVEASRKDTPKYIHADVVFSIFMCVYKHAYI